MRKFLLLAAVVALMLTIAVPAVAKQNDEKEEPQGSSINQEQNALIDQKSNGGSNAATVEFGNQNAAQAQYENPASQDQYDETGGSPSEMSRSEINQSQNAAIVQKGEGDGAENAATVEFGNQTATQVQYNNPATQDQGDDSQDDDSGDDQGEDTED